MIVSETMNRPNGRVLLAKFNVNPKQLEVRVLFKGGIKGRVQITKVRYIILSFLVFSFIFWKKKRMNIFG